MATADTDNVIPLQPGTAPEQPARAAGNARSKDRRAAARQAKRRSNIKADRDAGPSKNALSSPHIDAPPIAPTVTPTARNGVTRHDASPLAPNADPRAPARRQPVLLPRPRQTSAPLVTLAYGFFGLGVGINLWNAWTGGPLVDMALPAAMGVLAEGVMFFLPSWAMTLPLRRQILAVVLLVFVTAFALTNSLRMASVIAADQATARADRQTTGVMQASKELEDARTKRDLACGRGLAKTEACKAREREVTKLEGKHDQATAKVVTQAKPEAGDFAKLVAWISWGHLRPRTGDFEMLWLFFRTLLPQVGGLVLMLARR